MINIVGIILAVFAIGCNLAEAYFLSKEEKQNM